MGDCGHRPRGRRRSFRYRRPCPPRSRSSPRRRPRRARSRSSPRRRPCRQLVQEPLLRVAALVIRKQAVYPFSEASEGHLVGVAAIADVVVPRIQGRFPVEDAVPHAVRHEGELEDVFHDRLSGLQTRPQGAAQEPEPSCQSTGVEALSGVGADLVQLGTTGEPASTGADSAAAVAAALVALALPALLGAVAFGFVVLAVAQPLGVVALGVVARGAGAASASAIPPSGGAAPLAWGEALRWSVIADGASRTWCGCLHRAKREAAVACMRRGGGEPVGMCAGWGVPP